MIVVNNRFIELGLARKVCRIMANNRLIELGLPCLDLEASLPLVDPFEPIREPDTYTRTHTRIHTYTHTQTYTHT